MSLKFFTENHKMTFVDAITHHIRNAWSLLPNRMYHVYFEIQNDADHEEQNVHCQITHSPFGIGLPGTMTNVIQPAPVTVPPKGPPSDGVTSGNGLATVIFHYLTPPGGHACLYAKIFPNGPSIQQNTDVFSAPIGVPATFSFLVFGGHTPETMRIEVQERFENGGPVPAAQQWKAMLVAPAGIGPVTPTAPPVNLNLAADSFYSIGLETTPAGSVLHIFHVTGKVNGVNVGEVDIRIQPSPPIPQCEPYVTGGWHSPDIVLYDPVTGNPIPVGSVNDNLMPNTSYPMAAIIHNDSPTPAVNTVVRFWELTGNLLDIQTVTVPGMSSVTVHSAVPFVSNATPGWTKCAVVSIYNSNAKTCNKDAVTVPYVTACQPSPNNNRCCRAGRNTTSIQIPLMQNWEFSIDILMDPRPANISVIAQHVPEGLNDLQPVRDIEQILGYAGAQAGMPIYLMPAIRKILKSLDMGIKITPDSRLGQNILEEVKATPHKLTKDVTLTPAKMFQVKELKVKKALTSARFTISGKLPKNVNSGEKVLVHVIAHYDKTNDQPAHNVEYLATLFVENK